MIAFADDGGGDRVRFHPSLTRPEEPTTTPSVKLQELTSAEAAIVVRRRRGWTQAQAAKRAGLSVRALRAYEQGTRIPADDGERRLTNFVRRFG